MSLKKTLAEAGWQLFRTPSAPPFSPFSEVRYWSRRLFADIVCILPFLAALLWLLIVGKRRNSDPKVLLGTHPIVTFRLLRGVLKERFDTTLFVFSDYSNGSFHDGLSARDVVPSWLHGRDPYLFGPYWAFIWALKNYDLFCLYFDGGFLDRTIWWRLEPLITRLFGVKTLIVPYGADVWDTMRNANRAQKLGHILSRPNYFAADFKRIKRIYHTSRYADFIVGFANYIDFLPRIDCMVYHGHIVEDIANYRYSFEPSSSVRVLHYANDPVRKGTAAIDAALAGVEGISYESVHGLPREEALQKLLDAHIFVEQVTDGFFSFSALEAMLYGKVVVAYVDERLSGFYESLDREYYKRFFDSMPIVRATSQNVGDVVESLLLNMDALEQKSRQSREFAVALVEKNRKVWIEIVSSVLESR